MVEYEAIMGLDLEDQLNSLLDIKTGVENMGNMMVAAVSVISFFDNEMHTIIVPADENDGWKEVYTKACEDGVWGNDDWIDQKAWVAEMSDDLGEAKQDFYDGDLMIDIVFADYNDITK